MRRSAPSSAGPRRSQASSRKAAALGGLEGRGGGGAWLGAAGGKTRGPPHCKYWISFLAVCDSCGFPSGKDTADGPGEGAARLWEEAREILARNR